MDYFINRLIKDFLAVVMVGDGWASFCETVCQVFFIHDDYILHNRIGN